MKGRAMGVLYAQRDIIIIQLRPTRKGNRISATCAPIAANASRPCAMPTRASRAAHVCSLEQPRTEKSRAVRIDRWPIIITNSKIT